MGAGRFMHTSSLDRISVSIIIIIIIIMLSGERAHGPLLQSVQHSCPTTSKAMVFPH
jgi:hypothetical protein